MSKNFKLHRSALAIGVLAALAGSAYADVGSIIVRADSDQSGGEFLWLRAGNGDQAYANKAVEIMNAWSSTLKEAPLDDPNGSDPKNDAEFFQNRLLLGWSAESMVRGAEIIRHSNAGWKQEDIDKLKVNTPISKDALEDELSNNIDVEQYITNEN